MFRRVVGQEPGYICTPRFGSDLGTEQTVRLSGIDLLAMAIG